MDIMTPQFQPGFLPAVIPAYIPPPAGESPGEPVIYGSVRVDVTDYAAIRDTDLIRLDTTLHAWPVQIGPLSNYSPGYQAIAVQQGVSSNAQAARLLAQDLIGTGVGTADDRLAVAYYEGASNFYVLCQPRQVGTIAGVLTNSAGMTCTPMEMLTVHGTVTLDGGPVPDTFYELDIYDLIWDYTFVVSPVAPTYSVSNVPAGSPLNGVLLGDTASYNTYNEGISSPLWNQEFVTT